MGRRWAIALAWELCLATLCSGSLGAQTVLCSVGEARGLTAEDLPRELFTVVNVDLRDVSFEEALTTIARQGSFTLSYNRDRVPVQKRVSVTRREVRAVEALLQVLEMTGTELLVTREGQLAVRPSALAGKEQQQEGVLSGMVLDEETGEPLVGVSIAVVDVGRGSISGEDGTFMIPSMTPGTYAVRFSSIGYETRVLEDVDIEGDSTTHLDIALEQKLIRLKEIIVTPGAFAIMESESSTIQSLSREDIESVSQLGEDIYQVVNRLPGVSSSDFSARFTVRGGEHDEILALLDGMELYEPFHLKDIGAGALSIVDAEVIEGIDLLTGGFTAEYGNRLSGVFDMRTKRPRTDGTRYGLGVSLMNMRAMGEGTFADERGSWLFSARRGYLDIVLGIVGATDDVPSPVYYDIFNKVQYQLHPEHTLSLNVLHARDRMRGTGPEEVIRTLEHPEGGGGSSAEDETNTGYGNSYVWLSLKSSVTATLFARTIASAGKVTRDRYGIDYRKLPGRPDLVNYEIDDERTFDMVGLKQDWQYELSDRVYLKWGAEAKRLLSDYRYHKKNLVSTTHRDEPVAEPEMVETSTSLDREGSTLGAYLSNRIQLVDPLVLELGLRYDRASYTGDGDWSPRANGMLRLGDRTFLRCGWGKFRQYQGIHDMDVRDGHDTYYPAEVAEHWTAGVEHILPGGVQFRAEGYHKSLGDLQPSFRNWMGDFGFFPEAMSDRVEVIPERATSRGVEVYMKRDTGGRITWWGSYALAQVEERLLAVDAEEITVAYGRKQPGPNDQRHALNLDVNYRPNRRWTYNISWTYHTGWPYTRHYYRESATADGAVSHEVVAGELNGERLPAYHRMNARATRRLDTSHGRVRFFVELVNLYNHDNVASYHYHVRQDADGGFFYERDEENWFPLLPSIGMSWSMGG